MLWQLSPGGSKEEVLDGGSAEVTGEGVGSPGDNTRPLTSLFLVALYPTQSNVLFAKLTQGLYYVSAAELEDVGEGSAKKPSKSNRDTIRQERAHTPDLKRIPRSSKEGVSKTKISRFGAVSSNLNGTQIRFLHKMGPIVQAPLE